MNARHAACDECRTLVGGYVLGALEPHETDAVRRHLADCTDCAAEHARLAGLPALLALAVADDTATEPPPAALEEAVLDRFAREHRAARSAPEDDRAPRARRARLRGLARPFRRPLPAALAAAAAAAAITALAFALAGRDDAGESGATYEARLTGLAAAPGARASAELESTGSGTSVHLKVENLRSPRPGAVYELWCIGDDGTKISAGTFRVDSRGDAYAVLSTAAIPGTYHRMSIERRASADAARGEPVMAGEIEY